MKNINIFFYVSIVILMLTACESKKTPITTQYFSSKLSDKGFNIIDITERHEGKPNKALLAIDPSENYQIEFDNFTIKANLNKAFLNYKDSITGFGVWYSRKGISWEILSLTTKSTFSFVSYIENTLIFVTAPVEYKQAIVEIFREFGY